MADELTIVKRGHILAGIATAILGVVLLVWPGATLLTFAIILGLQLVIWGGATVITSFMVGSGGSMALGLIGGVLTIVLGIATFRSPDTTIVFLTIIVGAAWFVGGMFDLFDSFRGPGTKWGMLVYSILSIFAGVVLMGSPITSSATLAWASGIMLIVLGIARIFSATQLTEEFAELIDA